MRCLCVRRSLVLRQIGGRPTAAEGLDEQDGGIHPPAFNVDIVSLVCQRGLLRGHDLQVGIQPAHVAVVEDLLRTFCRDGRLMLLFGFGGQNP